MDNFNISKINVKFEHQFIAPFYKHLHKLPSCTLSLLILTTYTGSHLGETFLCKSWLEICCHVIEDVLKITLTSLAQYKRHVIQA